MSTEGMIAVLIICSSVVTISLSALESYDKRTEKIQETHIYKEHNCNRTGEP